MKKLVPLAVVLLIASSNAFTYYLTAYGQNYRPTPIVGCLMLGLFVFFWASIGFLAYGWLRYIGHAISIGERHFSAQIELPFESENDLKFDEIEMLMAVIMSPLVVVASVATFMLALLVTGKPQLGLQFS